VAEGSDTALVQVQDTGHGIPEEVRERIFEPFFSTKDSGEGTGLGLAICQRIVSQCGGEIRVSSREGEGTTFSVRLPFADSPGQATKGSSPGRKHQLPPGQSGRILVVDDEQLVGRSLQRLLRGHDVEVVQSARSGLQRLEGETFDVVFCDLTMPDMGGVDFYQHLRGCRPEMAERVVFMTGAAFSESAHALLDRVDNPCIEKPFDVRQVRNLVADMLQARRA
jgi:CheY-like chemotaxis protein